MGSAPGRGVLGRRGRIVHVPPRPAAFRPSLSVAHTRAERAARPGPELQQLRWRRQGRGGGGAGRGGAARGRARGEAAPAPASELQARRAPERSVSTSMAGLRRPQPGCYCRTAAAVNLLLGVFQVLLPCCRPGGAQGQGQPCAAVLALPLHPAPPSLSFRELLKSIRGRGEEGERGRRRKESGCNSRLVTFSDRSVPSSAPRPQTNRKLGSRGAWGQRRGPLAARAPEPLCAGPGRPGRSPRFVWRALGPRRGPASCSFVPRAWPPGTHPADARPRCCGMRSAEWPAGWLPRLRPPSTGTPDLARSPLSVRGAADLHPVHCVLVPGRLLRWPPL